MLFPKEFGVVIIFIGPHSVHGLIYDRYSSSQVGIEPTCLSTFGAQAMIKPPRNGFDDAVSAKRSAHAAARAATLATMTAEESKLEHIENMRQVALMASHAATRAAITAEAAELAAIAAEAASLAAAAAVAVEAAAAIHIASNAAEALKSTANNYGGEIPECVHPTIQGKFEAEAEAVSRLAKLATGSAKNAVLAAEAAADAAEMSALLAETAAGIVGNHK